MPRSSFEYVRLMLGAVPMSAALVLPCEALAQSIGASHLPKIRSTIADGTQRSSKTSANPDDETATSVVTSFAGGYTTNAGPALDGKSSPVTEASVSIEHVRPLSDGQLGFQADFSLRDFESQSEAENLYYRLKGSFASKDGDFSLSLGSEKHSDLDEKLSETGLTIERAWKAEGDSALIPFLRGSIAYLDYEDIPATFLEFANQDDRDRVSASSQAGVKYQFLKSTALTLALGGDSKTYITSADDFAIERNNQSVFVEAGAVYAADGLSASLLYAPVYRVYSDPLFEPLLAHTFTAAAQMAASEAVMLTASAHLGLEETDFLDAKVIHEFVATTGVMVTGDDKASATLAAAYTRRDFDGLDRVDQKYEILLSGQLPITDKFKLTAQVGYLLFNSSFGDATLDQVSSLVGFTYVVQ